MSTRTTSMVKMAYTCLKMTNKLIANLAAEKGNQPKDKVIPNGFTGLEKKKSPSQDCNPFDWVIIEVFCLPVPLLSLFMFLPNSIQQQKRKKNLLSVSVFSIQRAREIFSSPNAFFFFTFLLKGRQHDWGWQGPLEIMWSNLSTQSTVTYSSFMHMMSSYVSSIYKDRNFAGSISNMCLCFWQPHSLKVFFTFKRDFSYFSLCQFPLVLSLDPLSRLCPI